MDLKKLNSHRFNFDSDIQAAGLLHGEDIVVLNRDGDVILLINKSKEEKRLFEVAPDKGLHYSDGGYLPAEKSSIHTLENVFVVSNDYNTHCVLCNLDEGYSLHIQREDYYAKLSKYPIGLFKRDGAVHIIYSKQWNRVDIANTKIRQVLTVGKSLAEEGAEQSHIDYYKKNPSHEVNKLLWPSNFDYFYGDIKVSPNGKLFLSAGWVWGSFDCCKAFDMEKFINNTRVSSVDIMFGEHEGRSFCFVDDETVATVLNPYIEESFENEDNPENRYEIRLYTCSGKGMVRNIVLDKNYNLKDAQIFYSTKVNGFILFSDTLGLLIVSNDGKTLLDKPNMKISNYDEFSGLLIEIQQNCINIFDIDVTSV